MRVIHGERFDVPDGYLNSASIGIPPASAADAVADAVAAWRTGSAQPSQFDDPVARARAGFAELVGVPVDRVTQGATASSLVGLVAAGVPDRTRVLVAEGEFTSVSWPFAAQRGRGVTVEEAPLERVGELADAFRGLSFDTPTSSITLREDGQGLEDQLVGLSSHGDRFPFAVPRDMVIFPAAMVSAPVGQKSVDWLKTLKPEMVSQIPAPVATR